MAGTELLTNRLCVIAEYKQKPNKYVWGPGGIPELQLARGEGVCDPHTLQSEIHSESHQSS